MTAQDVRALADALESILTENAALRTEAGEHETCVAELLEENNSLRAEHQRLAKAAQRYIDSEHFVHSMQARDREWPDAQAAMSSAWQERKNTKRALAALLPSKETNE